MPHSPQLVGVRVDLNLLMLHVVQTASFEERDGADIELIFAALIHDVSNALSQENHSQVSATIIQPLSLDEVTWILQMHGLF